VGALLAATVPELVLTAGLVAILLMDAFGVSTPRLIPRISMAVIVLTFGITFKALLDGKTVVAGPLTVDTMAVLFRLLFLAAAAYMLLFAMRRGHAWFEQAEFQALLLASLAGMSVLSASTDMLTAYLAFETVSYTGYLMVGYNKQERVSSEAGLKYVIFGAASSGAMLYGITLLFGLAGSTSMASVAEVLRAEGPSPAAVAAAVLVFAGVAFKISAAPFHFWAPDAYSGASTPVAGFLAVASKAAGFAVAIRVLGTWCGSADPVPEGVHFGVLPPGPLPYWILAAGAAATMIVGNTAALRQSDLKRLLAWSSVAHAGYLLMALSVGTGEAYGAILFYFWVYMLMTLGGFGIVGLLRPHLGGTGISHYAGLGKRNPRLAICLTVLMISLTGLPPTAGFWGKVLLFMPVIQREYYGLAVLGLVASAASLYYYWALVKAMFLTPPAEGNDGKVELAGADWALVYFSTVPLLLGGLVGWWPAAEGFLNTAKDWVVVSLR
jgi:proton-translocating NADH-quinone oxidoreductase chain N